MNAILLARGQPPRTPSLLAFSDYREAEQANGAKHSSVTANGALLEYETLELRVHPPNVSVSTTLFPGNHPFKKHNLIPLLQRLISTTNATLTARSLL